MKTVKLNLLLVFAFMLSTTAVLHAQQNETDETTKQKKIYIVKSQTGEDGEVIIEKIVKEGEEGENMFFEVKVDSEDGETVEETIKVITSDDVEIIDIEGSNNVWINEDENIDIDVSNNIWVDVDGVNDGEKKVKVKIQRDGEEPKMLEWQGKGELPEDIKQQMGEAGIQWNSWEAGEDQGSNIFFVGDVEAMPSNKACLGVQIGHKREVIHENGEEFVFDTDNEEGVEIISVMDNSAAKVAGMTAGDVIVSINGTTTNTLEEVLEVLKPYDAGAEVAIAYLRDGQPVQTNAVLKTCQSMPTFTIKDVDANDTGKERIIIIKRHHEDGGVEEEVVVESDEPEELAIEPIAPSANALDLETLDIFPNPTDGQLTVQFTAPAKSTVVRIVDLNGKEVIRRDLNSFNGSFRETFNLSAQPKGTMILTIQQGDQTFTEKIILQ